MAEKAIEWMRTSNTLNPGTPFFMYFTPGAVHGPHHIFKEWADKYKKGVYVLKIVTEDNKTIYRRIIKK